MQTVIKQSIVLTLKRRKIVGYFILELKATAVTRNGTIFCYTSLYTTTLFFAQFDVFVYSHIVINLSIKWQIGTFDLHYVIVITPSRRDTCKCVWLKNITFSCLIQYTIAKYCGDTEFDIHFHMHYLFCTILIHVSRGHLSHAN